jgi:2,3-bisphosphoglycerate-dependent phosphoglycerate mutase
MDLSDAGVAEAHRAGELLRAHGLRFDRAFVSPLRRATRTLDIVRAELNQGELPVTIDWRLNERHYGALQGLDKAETAARYGAGQLHRWRRGYHDTPPPLAPSDPRHPQFDSRYAGVPLHRLPATESLADTERRVVPYWRWGIAPLLAAGQTALVVAHGNTLRELVKYSGRFHRCRSRAPGDSHRPAAADLLAGPAFWARPVIAAIYRCGMRNSLAVRGSGPYYFQYRNKLETCWRPTP